MKRKITKRNIRANKILKEIFENRGIIECELKLPGCWRNSALGFAHKEKRWKYIRWPEGLSDFNQVLLVCNPCHDIIEVDREKTLYFFRVLRDERKD